MPTAGATSPPLLADPATREAAAETLLVRLVALNAERAAEEAKGHIRWLRPEYQHPAGTPQQAGLPEAGASAADEASAPAAAPATRQPWPATLPEQVAAVARVLADAAAPLTEPTSPPASPAKAPGRNACRRSSTRSRRWGGYGGMLPGRYWCSDDQDFGGQLTSRTRM
jgi:hypothetical protein